VVGSSKGLWLWLCGRWAERNGLRGDGLERGFWSGGLCLFLLGGVWRVGFPFCCLLSFFLFEGSGEGARGCSELFR